MHPIKPGRDWAVNNQHRLNELAEAAAHRRAVREATEGHPTVLQGLASRVNAFTANITRNVHSAVKSEPVPPCTPLLETKRTFEA